MDLGLLAERFRIFAVRECSGSSALYEHLSLQIADDEDLLQLAAHARSGQPIPNLLFGAVHYLLLKGKQHRLVEYYASIVENPIDPSSTFTYFKDFCLRNQDEIITILQSKRVQTNEVRRCSYLYPAFSYIYERAKRPLALIEIGTSAGLQLFWDQYAYTYNSDEVYGNIDSDLVINSEIQGDQMPYLLKNSPPITTRIGVDLHVNHLDDLEDFCG